MLPSHPPPEKVDILLVDDQAANLLALEAILEVLGENLVRAGSGEEALRLMESRSFAVVLMDVQMPGLGGVATARTIRSRDNSRHTPIIFLTAYGDDEFPVVEAYRLGAVDYLIKPLIGEIVRAKVHVFVELFRQAREVQRQARLLHDARRSQAQRRSLAEHAVVGLLAEPTPLIEALQRSLQAVGEAFEWDLGVLWRIDAAGQKMDCAAVWHADDLEAREFEAACRGRTFAPGEGLPGRIWQSGEPSWIENLAAEHNMPRGPLAVRAGLRSGCALPIRLGEQTVGVLEFFSRANRPADEDLLRELANIARQVGQSLERRRAEEALRESEGRFRRMADVAPAFIWVANPDRRYTWVNRPWLEFTGLTLEQAMGEGWVECVHPDDRPATRKTFVESFDARRPFSMQYRLRRGDGQFRWVLDNGIPLAGPGGEFAGYVGSGVDVDVQKRAEEALQEADRRKDEFMAILGHELRNPLAPLRNAIEILKGHESTGSARALADMMERQVATLSRLTDEMLDIARVVRGRLPLHAEQLDLRVVISDAADAARPMAQRRGLRLEVEQPAEALWVEADPVRLGQILANLVSNACKYTEPGGSVRLSGSREGNAVVLRVRDSGIGLRPEVVPQLFEPFHQGDRLPGRVQEGLGIGLALVKRLAELHGGTVEAASAGPGKGSEFTVRLPLKSAAGGGRRSPGEETNSPSRAAHHAPRHAGRRVLVVDDNEDSAESLATLLRLRGHDARAANDGPSALALAQEFNPQVVFLDLGMPGMDGCEVARRLRGRPEGQGALIVAVTGWGQDEDRRRSKEAGFDHHLVKPADLRILDEMLAKSPRGT